MSMASSPQHEPTMEEILASIRKIISEDAPEAPPPAAPAAAAHAHEESDVLELTQEVHDEPAPPPAVIAAPAPEPTAEPAPVVAAAAPEAEPVKHPENDVVFQTIEEEVPVSSEAQAVAPHEGIFSDKTRKALEDSFASIQTPAKADDAPAASEAVEAPEPAADGSSVQAVFEKAVRDSFEPVMRKWIGEHSDAVVDKLKPLVREWMDEHFPALLEGAVRAEVERVARARH
jgi:cell pole-organizing protein PopZ